MNKGVEEGKGRVTTEGLVKNQVRPAIVYKIKQNENRKIIQIIHTAFWVQVTGPESTEK